jgi:purine nucleosidase
VNTIPILLDTDIGSDIDDAVALAYLLRQPRCELLGITTVSGEPEKRAMLADAVCQAGGRFDIPVHVGAAPPWLVPQIQPYAPQAEALTDRWPHSEFTKENTAIEFLRQTIRAQPGEITLLAIGPLTNIALLFAIDPEIPALLKSLTLMGGWFTSPRSEWNILCDPHSAAKVFAAPVPNLTAVGIDVTGRCRMPASECRRRFAQAGGALELVSAMAEVWFHNVPEIVFHDPLAAALIFDKTLCRTESQQIEVELTSPRLLGQTLLVPDAPTKPHQVATDVDSSAFFAHYFGIVGG